MIGSGFKGQIQFREGVGNNPKSRLNTAARWAVHSLLAVGLEAVRVNYQAEETTQIASGRCSLYLGWILGSP